MNIKIKMYDYDEVLDLQCDLLDEMEGCFVRSELADTATIVGWCEEPFSVKEFKNAIKEEFDWDD